MGLATALAIGGLAVSAGSAATQIIKGANAKSEADQAATDAANKIARIQEADKMKSLQVPTLGLGLAQQNIQARQAQDLQGLKDVGAAGVLGGLTAANQQARAEDLQLAAQANEMQYQRDQTVAQNAQQIEQNRAQREAGLESSRLSGAQNASSQAQANINAGMMGLANTAADAAFYAYKNIPQNTPQSGMNTNGTVTPDQAAKNATNAFAPQISSMKPNVQMTSVGPQLQANQLAGLRAEQGNYDQFLTNQQNIMRNQQNKFDSQYTWDPLNNQWIQKAPY